MNTELNPFVGKLHRSGLVATDLDHRVIGASMLMMYFFRLPEMVVVQGHGLFPSSDVVALRLSDLMVAVDETIRLCSLTWSNK